MTMRQRTGSPRHRLWRVVGLVSLAVQLALPAAHQLAIDTHEHPSQVVRASGVAAADASRAAWRTPSHDPASCPICCSLRASSAAAAATAYEHPLGAVAALPPAAPARADVTLARRAHPPRAPPASFFLV